MNNYLKTSILLAGLTALLFTVGYMLGGNGLAFSFLIVGIVINLVSFFFADKIALSMAGAQPLAESQAPFVYEDTRLLASRMGIPMPKLYYTNQMQPNAFATGRGPATGVVCLTQGIMQSLSRDELRGVIAHELAHIRNRDVLTATIAAILAGTVSSLVNVAFWTSSSDDNDRNPLVAILLIILAPISATLIQLAISRSREFAADEVAAKHTQEPKSLANALLKISQTAEIIPMQENPALSSLYIANPLGLSGLSNLFSTHPPVEKRVQALLSM